MFDTLFEMHDAIISTVGQVDRVRIAVAHDEVIRDHRRQREPQRRCVFESAFKQFEQDIQTVF